MGSSTKTNAVLKNQEGSEDLKKKEIIYEMEGASFEDLSYSKLTKLNLDGGVIVKILLDGKWKKAGLSEGFIITHIDKVAIDHVGDLNQVMEMKRGGVLVEGLFSNGEKGTIGMEW